MLLHAVISHMSSRNRRTLSALAALGIFTVPILFLGYGLAFALIQLLNQEVRDYTLNGKHFFFFGGVVAWTVLYILVLKRNRSFIFWRTADHEFCHILAAVLTLRQVGSVTWNDTGRGCVTVDRRTFLVDQAPYIVRIPVIVALIIILWINPQAGWWLSLSAGIMLGYYFGSVIQESLNDKADIRKGYVIFHLCWSVAALYLWTGVAVSAAGKGGDGVRAFLGETWEATLSLVQTILL